MDPLHVVVYSDFLCPWCWNAATRLASVEERLSGRVAFEWRSYLLRPEKKEGRSLEKFRAYTQSWLRVAADEPRAPFQVWQGDAGPPTHSVPAHLAAKAAASLGEPEGRRMRDRLFRAYFAENRDISHADTLRALWRELELPEDAYERCSDPALARQVVDEHNEAIRCGATGVPAARLGDNDFVLMGAQPEETYTRWFERALARDAG